MTAMYQNMQPGDDACKHILHKALPFTGHNSTPPRSSSWPSAHPFSAAVSSALESMTEESPAGKEVFKLGGLNMYPALLYSRTTLLSLSCLPGEVAALVAWQACMLSLFPPLLDTAQQLHLYTVWPGLRQQSDRTPFSWSTFR
ncbi:hypothetical protein CVIRNUC_005880 [Coccomyxa viridis]|uniref:Uncharacterized protein n=1 Tax=Coccomyxa viridis TaxID=1274662 RepID=A0AAV1I8Q6_9CHLO|nr:hypothetical protein CVIRNUC_005880 [Coccomyxa viridis]